MCVSVCVAGPLSLVIAGGVNLFYSKQHLQHTFVGGLEHGKCFSSSTAHAGAPGDLPIVSNLR